MRERRRRGGGDSHPQQSQAFKDEVGASRRRPDHSKLKLIADRKEGSQMQTWDLQASGRAGGQRREGLLLTPLCGEITSGGVL